MKALVVDDEMKTRRVLVSCLSWASLGVTEILEADDGLKAIEIASDFKPDIILTDIRMPKMTGISMAERIREKLPDCQFVFLSGYSDKEYLKSAIRLKAIRYVEKPIDLDEIMEALKEATDEVAKLQEASAKNLPLLRQKMCLALTGNMSQGMNRSFDFQVPEFELTGNGSYTSAIFWFVPSEACFRAYEPSLEKMIQPVVQNTFAPFEGRCLMAFKGEEYLVIHFKLEHPYDMRFFTGLVNRFRVEFNSLYNGLWSIYAGIGHEVKSKEYIYTSYQAAVIALKRCFFSGDMELSSNDDSPTYVFDNNALSELSEYLKNGKYDRAILYINNLENDINKYKNTQIDYIKNIFSNVLILLMRFGEDHNIVFLKNISTHMEHITRSPTLKDITRHIVALIKVIANELDERKKDVDVIAKATSYILKNFFDKDLSINKIAEVLYLTPNYLNSLFKKETGKTINQFITEVRVTHSKQYLKDSGIKLYQIADKVGYTDGKYFAKVFEKNVGIKPKEYRERQCIETNNI